MMFLNIILCLSSFLFAVKAAVKVEPSTHFFVDEYSRIRIFHGVNAVYKIAPWHPNLDGFDPSNSLSSIDANNLKAWGFNVVRLGVMWPGIEPGSRGEYNKEYMDSIQTIVENLATEGVYVVLDFHQDLFHRKYCGEGVPDYVYEVCSRAQDESTPEFPLPSVNNSYPLDDDGNPKLDSCLSVMFATYYLSAEVGAGFQCLYENTDNLWDAFAGYWVQIAKRFSSFDNVLGYELINEPWAGDVYKHPDLLLPGRTEKQYLEPMYAHLHKAIREVDDEKIIFYEGLTIDYWPSGFSQGPGGSAYNDRQAYAYHIYCPLQDPNVKAEVACDAINDEFFAMRTKDVERVGGGWIMTEFGASEDVKGDMYALEKAMQLADKHKQSWMYWQFKYYQDLTTCTPMGESLYQDDGTVCEHKIRILSRTYPQAVAGTLDSYHFDPITARFTLKYGLLPPSSAVTTTTTATAAVAAAVDVAGGSNSTAAGGLLPAEGRTTIVYFNRELYYPHGAMVNITTTGTNVPSTALSVSCSHNSNTIKLIQPASGDQEDVTVAITPCLLINLAACTCK